jgi:ubiquitin C-terminal hydrolase
MTEISIMKNVSESSDESIDITLGISKFVNIRGVTCYMNSILAILQQMPIFADYVLCGIFKPELLNRYPSDKLEKSIMYSLYNLFKLSASNDNFNITPSSFRTAISMKDDMWGQQQHQDSQEFLTFLLSQIENDISSKVQFIPGLTFTDSTENKLTRPVSYYTTQILATNMWQRFIKNEYSIVKTLMTGMTRMTTKCEFCSNISNNFDIFQTLQLSLPVNSSQMFRTLTLKECLDHYTIDEKLDKDNKLTCNLCYMKNRSSKKTILWKTPQILIIHLKRFIVNCFGIPTQKLNNMIEYPITNLNIKDYIDPMSPDYNNSTYNLFGVNCHHNLSNSLISTINYGHYTSYVKNRYDNTWYEFDDNTVSKKENIVSKNAYMLFYELKR